MVEKITFERPPQFNKSIDSWLLRFLSKLTLRLNDIIGAAGGGAPTDAKYLVTEADATLTAEKVLGSDFKVLHVPEAYSTIANALAAASAGDIVLVAPGTYNENLTMSTSQVTLMGHGVSTLINGGATGDAIYVSADYCTIKSLSVKTTPGNGNPYCGISTVGAYTYISDVIVQDADKHGITILGGADRTRIYNCLIIQVDDFAIRTVTDRFTILGCIVVNNARDTNRNIDIGGSYGTITGCSVVAGSYAGIYLTSGSSYVAVAANYVGYRVVNGGSNNEVGHNA